MADGTLFEGVGWSSSLPPNAAAFMDQPDPSLPPDTLRTPGDPHVAALRAELRENSGMQSLEICRPDEVERAVELLRRDGVAVVNDAFGFVNSSQTQAQWDIRQCPRIHQAFSQLWGTTIRVEVVNWLHETASAEHLFSTSSG